MTGSIVRIVALMLLIMVFGGPVAAQTPEMKTPPVSGQRIAPLPQRAVDPCHSLSPEVCAQACGRNLHALTTSYNQRYQSCVRARTDAFNATTATGLHAACGQYGFTTVDSCLNGVSGAIAKTCESEGAPKLAQVQAKAEQCRAEAPQKLAPREFKK